MEKIIFVVITKIYWKEDGNTADDLATLDKDGVININETERRDVPGEELIRIRIPVFQMGEILILNEYGREFGGGGRKPSKWFVEYEEFDKIENAVEKAKECREW